MSSQNNISNFSVSLVSSPVAFTISNGMNYSYSDRPIYLQGQFFAKSTIKMHAEPKTTATLQLSNVDGSSDFIQVILFLTSNN